jgi:hypothetical protein
MLHLIAIKFSRFLNEVKAEIGNKKTTLHWILVLSN